MKKRHYNKIINHIDSIENQSEIKPSELSSKINVNKKDIENVFKSLISDGHVINLTSKTDLEIIIAKDDYFDYSSLLENPSHIRYRLKNKHINTAIGILGLIVALLIAYLQGLFDSFLNIV